MHNPNCDDVSFYSCIFFSWRRTDGLNSIEFLCEFSSFILKNRTKLQGEILMIFPWRKRSTLGDFQTFQFVFAFRYWYYFFRCWSYRGLVALRRCKVLFDAYSLSHARTAEIIFWTLFLKTASFASCLFIRQFHSPTPYKLQHHIDYVKLCHYSANSYSIDVFIYAEFTAKHPFRVC